MSQQRNNKPENRQLGTIFKRTNKDTGELIKDDEGRQQYTFVLNKDVEITINGKKYESSYFYVNRPDDKFKTMLESGKITEAEYDEKVSRYKEGGDLTNVVFEIVKVQPKK